MGILIEFNIISQDQYTSKRETLSAFIKVHPWIKLDYNKPWESLYYWLQLYNKAANLDEKQYLIIHTTGEIDITTIE